MMWEGFWDLLEVIQIGGKAVVDEERCERGNMEIVNISATTGPNHTSIDALGRGF